MLYSGWISLKERASTTQGCWDKTIQQWQGELETTWAELELESEDGVVETIPGSPIKLQKRRRQGSGFCYQFV